MQPINSCRYSPGRHGTFDSPLRPNLFGKHPLGKVPFQALLGCRLPHFNPALK